LISSQGELAHRALKAFYPLTSKIDTPAQLVKHERRRRFLRRVADIGHASQTTEQALVDSVPAGFKDHHYIPKLSRNNPLHIFSFLRGHGDDPAVVVSAALLIVHLTHDNAQAFMPRLKDHILYRLRKLDVTYCDHTFTDDERNSVVILDNRLHSVQTMQVNFSYCEFGQCVILQPHRSITRLMTFDGSMIP